MMRTGGPMPKILAFAASLRAGSWNKKLVRVAAQGARDAGADVTIIDLADYPLPLYNGDDEARDGLPANVHKLKDLCREHHGFLVASPEYNAGYSGVLKNCTDWLSRPRDGEKPFEIFAMKPAAAMSASPGALGGNRMLATLRGHLLHLQMLVIPQTYGLVRAAEAFDDDGALTDAKVDAAVKKLGRTVAELAAKLAG
jgi:chromate reductase, NAD(P)H dehydrogenase (quinone)